MDHRGQPTQKLTFPEIRGKEEKFRSQLSVSIDTLVAEFHRADQLPLVWGVSSGVGMNSNRIELSFKTPGNPPLSSETYERLENFLRKVQAATGYYAEYRFSLDGEICGIASDGNHYTDSNW